MATSLIATDHRYALAKAAQKIAGPFFIVRHPDFATTSRLIVTLP
jgi:hypothetical protein